MKINITEGKCTTYRIAKTFFLDFEVKTGKGESETMELEIEKWVNDDDYNVDNGVEFLDGSQEKYDSLSEEQQSEVDDFIHDIKL